MGQASTPTVSDPIFGERKLAPPARVSSPRRELLSPAPWDDRNVDGVIIVDKAEGWTSHDVVGKMRRIANTKKIGHLGTLDPIATGVCRW